MGVGDKLKKVLKDKKLRQTEFAEAIDENLSQLNKVLNNQRTISFEMLKKVVTYFPDLDVNWLLRKDSEQGTFVNESKAEYYTPKTANELLTEIETRVERLRNMLSEED